MKTSTLILIGVCILFLLSACTSLGDPQGNPPIDLQPTAPIEGSATGATSPQTAIPEAGEDTLITDPALVIENYDQLFSQFQQKVYTTEWIRRVFEITYFNNFSKEYLDPQVKEEWLLFGENGQVAQAYNWLTTPSGEILQEAYYHDGVFTNVTSGITTMGGTPYPRSSEELHDFTGNFAEKLKTGKNQQQEAMILKDTPVWRFTTEIQDGELQFVIALYINRETNLLAGSETYLVEPNGNLKLVSGIIYTSFEIGSEPPIEHFEQILQKATALPANP